ncbi:meiosis-specific nuclear structural protein 1-like [Teleopsis dalmanni]|uniref:meiosis-specific nuclear structural protein 1-like n=1 Tax=Teleopsis dalmanni TaxID=139649 RepID=UPI0018CD580F|nr:meiosis-specific nuclear structural protein 1-like [Teleopsis dalmanni]
MNNIFNNTEHKTVQNKNVPINPELRARKREEFIKEKRSQLLRENNEDLRQLERSLRNAYIYKELDLQKAELERKRETEKISKLEEQVRISKELEELKEKQKAEEEKIRLQKVQFRDMLQQQIAEINKRRLDKYEVAVCEHVEMQKLIKNLEDELYAESLALMQQREHAKQEMELWKQKKEHLQALENMRDKLENENIIRIQEQRDAEQRRLRSIRQHAMEEKRLLADTIGQQLHRAETEKQRRENVLQNLLIEECKAVEDFRYRQNLERQERQRMQVREEIEKHRAELLQQKLDSQKAKEEQIRIERLNMLAERDKLEQLSDQRRRQKKLEHKREVEEMLKELRNRRTEEQIKQIHERDLQLLIERQRLQEIEDERQKILRKHPKEIIKLLPPNILGEKDKSFLKDTN